MKVYESLSRKELEERFKPIQLPSPNWPFSQTLIQNIVKRQTTPTGKVIYLVQFKDGQTRKISANVLNESHKKLVEDFEIEMFRFKEQPLKRRKIPLKRKNSPPLSTKMLKKRVRFESNSESSDDLSNFIVNSSEEEETEGIAQTQPFAITRSGRQTNKKMTFENEFYPNGVKVKTKTSTYICSVPLYENSDFIKNHSEHCFRCDGTGYYNSSVEVPIGNSAKRMRLLLCKTCSYAVHNNCLPNGKTSQHFNNGEYQCIKCSGKKSLCQYDLTALTKKTEKEIPFRCNACSRGFHQKCFTKAVSMGLANQLKELEMDDLYAKGLCIECSTFGIKLGSAIGEREVDNKKELLIKWKNISHRHTNWVSESWFKHAQQTAYKAYIKKKSEPTFEALSSVPIEWKTVDRILNVEWENKSKLKAKRILVVYKDISYDGAVWDDPPSEDDTELYPEYKLALERYIKATQVTPPENIPQLISNVRRMAIKEGYEKHEFKSQPDFITGGTLMKHQMEALNWLLYQWEHKLSCVLADDMGLGKTIQIIGYLYVLFKKYKIYPFVIVVPNSTATNWVREFQKWAPDMTVAPYYGGQVSRKLAIDNEILDKHRRLRCHVVVTTYESSMEISELHRIFWAVMVVDESQRLKNDQSLLFRTLKRYKVDQITLLTGTPLQNNLRELFNIMNFIQPKNFHGSEAEHYTEMTHANIEDLHNRLRPHFLRRTKEEVLKSLPPKYELIVPLSMTLIQKEVYKDCLNKDIYETLSRATGAKVQRGLTSIFMNLRKVLNHPYLLDGVERVQKSATETQTAMINACEKLKVFHQMFPKLKAQGHRLLIFSTMKRTLDILEDYFNFEKIRFTRIDGGCNERARVRSIDAFNAPNSKLDVFLLSTRAGGVGINLATADTIVIWDSDFNPYADLQAISRAHRIGQNKMVLILRFMTRLSIEEKVLQIGKKKMALEHVVVERMKEKDEESYDDIESILKFGTEALFSDDSSKDIHYDSASLDNLLDREKYREAAIKAQEEEIAAVEEGKEKTSEQGLSFSFAKVWRKDGSLGDIDSDDNNNNTSIEEDFWQKYLKQKEIEEAEKKEKDKLATESLGRGARKRVAVTYAENYRPTESDQHDNDAYDPGDEASEPFADDEDSEPFRLIRINGPKRTESSNTNNVALQIQEYIHDTTQSNTQLNNLTTEQQQQQLQQHQLQQHQLQLQQLQLQQSQQQQQYQPYQPRIPLVHSRFLHPNYQQNLYDDMLNISQEPLARLKAITTKAFKDEMQHSPGFHECTQELHKRLFEMVNAHFKMQFFTQFKNGEATKVDIDILREVYNCQNAILESNMPCLTNHVNRVMQEHFQKLTAISTQEKARIRSISGKTAQIPNTQHQAQQIYQFPSIGQQQQQHGQQYTASTLPQAVQPSMIFLSPQQAQQNTILSNPQQIPMRTVQPAYQQVQQATVTSFPTQQNAILPPSQYVQHSIVLPMQQEQQRQIEAQMRFQRENLVGQPVHQEIVQPSQQENNCNFHQILTAADRMKIALERVKEQTLRETKEKADREAKQRQNLVRQQAAAEQQTMDLIEKNRVERKRSENIAQEAKELVAREQIKQIREQAERVAREKTEREAREQAERIAREQAEQVAREQAERVAREQAERVAREQAERVAREQAERVARERAEETERGTQNEIQQRERAKFDEQSKQIIQIQENLKNEQALKSLQSSSPTSNSQSVHQLPEVMTRSMIMSMANYFSKHEGQNISSQDFLTHINQIAKKEAEERYNESQPETGKMTRALEDHRIAEENRKEDFPASRSKLNEEAAKMLEDQQKREAQTMNELRIHMMSPNTNTQLQRQKQQKQQQVQAQIDSQFTAVNPTLIARSNAALFKNVSSEIQQSLFSAPPPQPDRSFLDRFEKSTASSLATSPTSPAKLNYHPNNKNQSINQNH